MKKLLFITTSSLAANPRLVKEFESLKNDFNCFVLCFKHQDWSLELSEAIKNKNPEVHFIEIDRHVDIYQTLLSKIIHKVSIAFNSIFSKNLKVFAFASNDKTLQLYLKTKSLSKKNNFIRVIAHNLGAFYAAVKLSEEKCIALQLDIEDFYPGEALYFNKSKEKQNRMQLMSHSFLKADSITYASEGIALECQKRFEIRAETQQCTILNVFIADDFIEPIKKNPEPIKCVWFSQHIGPNRGLEQIFKTAENLKDIEFHLIGNCNHKYLDGQDLSANIKFHDSMMQKDLHKFLSQMDIGLALENAMADHNRNICLTNKILAYAQAGLYILATDTFGQNQFLNSLEYTAGIIMTSSLQVELQNLNRLELQSTTKIGRWEKAKSYSWDKEQLKLKALIR